MAHLEVIFSGQDGVRTDHLDWSITQSHQLLCVDEKTLSCAKRCQPNLEENVNEANLLSGPRTETISGLWTEKLSGPRTETLSGPRTETLSGPRTETLSGPRTETLSGPRTETLSGPRTETLSGPRTETLSGPRTETLSGPRTEMLSGRWFESLSAPRTETLSAPLTATHSELLPETISAPRTATLSGPRTETLPVGRVCRLAGWGLDEEVGICYDEQFETPFPGVADQKDVQLLEEEANYDGFSWDSSRDPQDGVQERSLLSVNDFLVDSSEKSADYGFIGAVTFLVTGISLVVISYTVPRDVEVNPDSVSAREMERLERESARLGAHLDRCVIAGLCLLTLGGVVLSTLLMISMYKGEMIRRQAFAYSKHHARLYGSINFRSGAGTSRAPSVLSLHDEDVLSEVLS